MAAAAAAETHEQESREPLLQVSSSTFEEADLIAAVHQQQQQQQKHPPPSYLHSEFIMLLRKLVGETLASFMVIFTIMAAKVNLYSLEDDGAGSLLGLGISGGLVTTVTIFALSHVSGSHINPVVTISYTLIKHFPLQLAPMYVCAQLIGGILATLVLKVVYNPPWSLVLVTPSVSTLEAVAAEGVAGFLLLFVCASVVTDVRATGQFTGLAIGSIISLNIILVGPVSGGGINPVRALGPALIGWDFEDAWIYVVGPLVGGILGASLYLFLRPEEVKKAGVHKEFDIKDITRSFFVHNTADTTPTRLINRA